MADGARVVVDLVVVTALGRLVAEEVDRGVLDAARLLGLVLEVRQAERLVPAGGEDVEGDLAADREAVVRRGEMRLAIVITRLFFLCNATVTESDKGEEGGDVRQSQVAEALPKLLDHGGAHLVLVVVLEEVETLLMARVTADRADVDHAVAELDESAALDGDVHVGNVVQDERGQLLVLLLSDPLDEAAGRQRLAVLEGSQAVLGKAEVEERQDVDGRRAQLLLLLGEVGAADEADGDLLAETSEEVQHLRGGTLRSSGTWVLVRAPIPRSRSTSVSPCPSCRLSTDPVYWMSRVRGRRDGRTHWQAYYGRHITESKKGKE